MPLRVKLTDRFQKQLTEWTQKRKIFKNKQELEEKFDQALETWKSSKTRERAEALLSDQGKLEHFLQNIEKKLARLPFGGDKFSAIPGMISMVRSYVKREYTTLPKGAILATIGALIYFFSPLDALPDFLFGPGLLDDAFVLNACLKLVKSDVEDFRNWQASQWKVEE
ncbi:YkvA family protein [Streptococcus suis]|uniref:YkvA family protein n=1 Tax=Streptococcus suis TaxID=1307 RepID=UPI000CF4F00F|nr:YkvA family protein [Streptococcus suis]MCL4935054.1 YkvA family protein [Streptococcus suis]